MAACIFFSLREKGVSCLCLLAALGILEIGLVGSGIYFFFFVELFE